MTLLVDPAGRARMTPLARICLRLPDDIVFFFLAVLSFSDYQLMASLSTSVLLIINETVNYTYYLKLFFLFTTSSSEIYSRNGSPPSRA